MRAPLLALAIGLLAAPSAFAWCPAPEAKACSAWFQSDQVYYGKVVKIDRGQDTIRYTVEVEKAFKGRMKRTEVVSTENTSTRWWAEIDEHRMVFAWDGRTWDWCSPIDDPRRVDETIDAIRAIPKARNGTVEGEVISQRADQQSVAGIQVAVEGKRRYEAVTDDKGRFSVEVEPGPYRMVVPGFEPFTPYSRSDVDGFTVVRGQCAQFRLVNKPN